jgi:hypothetical protein
VNDLRTYSAISVASDMCGERWCHKRNTVDLRVIL